MTDILVQQTTTVSEGTTYNFTYKDVYDGDKAIQLWFNEDGIHTAPSFINKGSIYFTSPVEVYASIALISIVTTSFWRDAAVENYGTLSVHAAGGFAWGVRANSWAPAVINKGTLIVKSDVGQAIGMEAWGFHPDQSLDTFNNSGTLSVTGATSAFGLYLPNGGRIVNSGDILVSTTGHGASTYGISIPAIGTGTIYNSGRIIVTGQNDSDVCAISFFGNGEGAMFGALSIVNDGEITGTIAILENNASGNAVSEFSGQSVENHGVINGLVYLGFGNDTVLNTGMVHGDIDLGIDNDVYNGAGGSLDGTLYAGDGDDLLIAGNGSSTFFGEVGDDRFQAGAGIAYFDGGSGTDTLDFSASSIAVALDLALSGLQTYANGRQVKLTSFEGLSGSSFADTLAGNDGANLIEGNAGDDSLSGRAGDDNLLGGAGNDTLNGGDGNDVLDGGDGTNSLTGGSGNDRFVFLKTSGNETITDFNTAQDVVDLSGDDGYDSYSAIQSGENVIITLSNQHKITLQNVLLQNLTANNFLLLDPTPRNLVGTDNADILNGGINADLLNGAGGNDTLVGGRGNDRLIGGTGNDTIIGGEGIDMVDYSADRHMVVVSLNNGTAYQWLSNGSFVDILSSIENIRGSAYEDTLVGSDGANIIAGGKGADHIYGEGGADILSGDQGDDIIDGGAGSDILSGGLDNDTYWVDNAGDTVTELNGGGMDLVYSFVTFATGTQYIENLTLAGNANINGYGNALNNILTGNNGNNVLNGGGGADSLIGGNGNDTYYVDNLGDVVTELSGGGKDLIISSVSFSLAAQYIENLTLTGTASINAYGNALNNILIGNSGNNALNGSTGADSMIGGLGNDTYFVDNIGDAITEANGAGTDLVSSSITFALGSQYIENLTLTGTANINGSGNALNNILTGNSGNNVLSGGGGADSMIGGLGNDTYFVDNIGDTITEANGAGTDLVSSSVTFALGSQYIENLTLTGTTNINGSGNALNNILTGNSGNNILSGGGGADSMIGGLGNDTYFVDNAGDTVTEANGGGTDLVSSSVTFSLGSQYIENLTLTGTANINGSGNALSNTLTGNSGNNTLSGGGGNDTLIGGLGSDIFFFGFGSGADKINDFSASQNDTLNLHAYNQATAVFTQIGADTVIDLGGGNIITVLNTVKNDVMSHVTW
jgi:Ca2+-binding RTX toxin-like protein